MSVTWTSSRQTLTLPLTRSGVLEALLLRPGGGADSARSGRPACQGEMGGEMRGRWSHSSEVNMSAVLTHRKLPCSNLVVLSIYSTLSLPSKWAATSKLRARRCYPQHAKYSPVYRNVARVQ